MKFIDNITCTVKSDMENTVTKDSHISIAASYFSIFAFEALKKELLDIAELRLIFTSPTFISEKAAKENLNEEIQSQPNTMQVPCKYHASLRSCFKS